MDSRPEMYPGGEMSPEQYWEAELNVRGEHLPFLMMNTESSQIKVHGEKIDVSRANTSVFLFNDIEYEGMQLNYDNLDHVYITREGKKPIYIFRPEDQDSDNHETWERLVRVCSNLGCNITNGTPTQTDLEQQYTAYRGKQTLDSGIEAILKEAIED